jgi:hypothetical protein
MVDYKVDASQDIIKFIWDKLQAAGVMSPSDYLLSNEGITVVPFVPVQELPEFYNQLGDKPYIVYTTSSVDATNDTDWWRSRDSIQFMIFCPDVNKIISIKNVMVDFLRRFDDSAQLINKTSGLSGKYNFHCVYVMKTEVSGESTDEGGRSTGEVIIDYTYVRYLDTSGNFA